MKNAFSKIKNKPKLVQKYYIKGRTITAFERTTFFSFIHIQILMDSCYFRKQCFIGFSIESSVNWRNICIVYLIAPVLMNSKRRAFESSPVLYLCVPNSNNMFYFLVLMGSLVPCRQPCLLGCLSVLQIRSAAFVCDSWEQHGHASFFLKEQLYNAWLFI